MIAVVTDSTCDLPEDLVEQHGVVVVPALITIGQQSLRDGVDMTREAFYEQLPHLPAIPTTSAPGPGAFAEVYERLLRQADHIVSIHVASRLSGILNAAWVAAQEIAPDRIHLVDTGQVSMGVGWAVLAAVDAIRESATLEGVLHSVQDTLKRTRLYATLNTLNYLAKSGRVNMVQAGLATLMNIKPVVQLQNGVLSAVARVRTWSRAVGSMADRVRVLDPLERLAVMHTNWVDGAQEFMGRLRDLVPQATQTLITNATTVIGAHVGPRAVGVAAVIARSGRQ